jgi:hypothetical protein
MPCTQYDTLLNTLQTFFDYEEEQHYIDLTKDILDAPDNWKPILEDFDDGTSDEMHTIVQECIVKVQAILHPIAKPSRPRPKPAKTALNFISMTKAISKAKKGTEIAIQIERKKDGKIPPAVTKFGSENLEELLEADLATLKEVITFITEKNEHITTMAMASIVWHLASAECKLSICKEFPVKTSSGPRKASNYNLFQKLMKRVIKEHESQMVTITSLNSINPSAKTQSYAHLMADYQDQEIDLGALITDLKHKLKEDEGVTSHVTTYVTALIWGFIDRTTIRL